MTAQMSRDLRIFEEGHKFHTREPVAKATATPPSRTRAHLKAASPDPERDSSGATGTSKRPVTFAPHLQRPHPPAFPPPSKIMKPQGKQQAVQRARSDTASRSTEAKRGPSVGARAPDMSEELTIEQVQGVFRMLAPIAKVINPRTAMCVRPARPSRSAKPSLGYAQ